MSKEKVMRDFLKVSLAILLCLGLGTVVSAQTPDGETPSQEDVCDGQKGAAFGLCNAYCEAMDCDSDNPNANAKACDRVKGNFERITGERLPCDLFCPCFTAEDLQQGTIALCADPFPGFPDLAGIIYTDGRRVCSGALCGTVDGSLSCAIQPISGGLIIELVTAEENADCRTLIGEACPAPPITSNGLAPSHLPGTTFIE
jgi:hypothetical protein